MSETLTSIMNRYGSDKGNGHHNYTSYYSFLFDKRRFDKLNILEIGIGSINSSIPSNMCGTKGKYQPGASLRGWRDYFENSQIFGCDIDKEILFTDRNITTFYFDQKGEDKLEKYDSFDIIIDDGLHHFPTNLNVMKSLLYKIKPGGYYVIEDIINHEYDPDAVSQVFKDLDGYNYEFIRLDNPRNNIDNNLLVVKRSL